MGGALKRYQQYCLDVDYAAEWLEYAEYAVAELEAELAALKARRCDTCAHADCIGDDPLYCGRHSMWWPPDWCCSEWAAREEA